MMSENEMEARLLDLEGEALRLEKQKVAILERIAKALETMPIPEIEKNLDGIYECLKR